MVCSNRSAPTCRMIVERTSASETSGSVTIWAIWLNTRNGVDGDVGHCGLGFGVSGSCGTLDAGDGDVEQVEDFVGSVHQGGRNGGGQDLVAPLGGEPLDGLGGRTVADRRQVPDSVGVQHGEIELVGADFSEEVDLGDLFLDRSRSSGRCLAAQPDPWRHAQV